MKKILNFRPLFYCFIAFFTAILFAPYLFKTNWIYISIFTILVFGLLLLSILRKKIKIYLCILIFATAGLLGYCMDASTYNVESFSGTPTVIGRVQSVSKQSSTQTVVLDNIFINDKEISENIYIKIYGPPYLTTGDIITYKAKVETTPAFNENYFKSYDYKNNIRYSSSISGSNIQLLGNNVTFAETTRNAVKEKLQKFMSEDNSSLAYAMLFGDQSDVDSATLKDYRGSGIAHVLSVSGLHVAIIVGFLYWVLKKLRCKNIISFILITTLLVFYCYLCSFSVSVVRSSLMSVCLLGSTLLGRSYDSLSSIGLSGLLILIFNPFYAFDISFQLSFGSVIGIIMFYGFFNSAFRKIKMPRFLSSALSVSISSQFFIFPVMLNSFGGSSFFSVFLNVLVIPIFSIAYIIIFISTPLLFVSSFFGNFLWFSNLLMQGINLSANFVASLSWSIIPKINLSFAVMLGFYSIVFIFSKYVFLNMKTKTIICLSILAMTSILVGFSYI